MSLKLGSNDTAVLAGSSVVKQMLLGTSPKFAAPVLDHVPGAAAAYSLRRLSNAYSGPVVKVRRSSDSTTADFTAAEVVDGSLEAWVGAGDGFVDTWYDQSGNARNATQATDGYQPKVVSSGVLVTEDGKPAVQFDGIDDRLSFSDIETDSAVSTFTVTRRQSAGLRSVILSSATVGSGTLSAYEFSDNKTYVGNRTGYIVSDSALSEQVMYSTFSPDYLSTVGMSLYRHGALLATTSGVLAASAPINSIGKRASEYATGTAQELIIYPTDVSASRELAEGEIAWHYGLQAKLPYDHAYAPQALGGSSQTVPTDSDVLAFAAASGAKSIPDLNKIEDLVAYLKAESLWDYARFYPMKSSQNAGTGSTVYGLGGLTTNNMTLVNSPTWGSDGVTFASASTQYATAGDFLSDADPARFIFFRGTLAGTHADGSTRSFVSQWKDPDGRGTLFGYNNLDGRISLFRTSDGTSGTQERYDGSDSLFSGIDVCAVAKFSLASRFLWANKTSVPVSLISGSAQSTTADSSGLVVVGNIDGFTGAPSQLDDVSMVGFIEGSDLTTTQRETITDLINAL